MTSAITRTTLTLPSDLLVEVDRAVREGIAPTRAAFVVAALRHELAARRRTAIDAAFAGMAEDADCQKEAIAISKEFALADAEAFRLAERPDRDLETILASDAVLSRDWQRPEEDAAWGRFVKGKSAP